MNDAELDALLARGALSGPTRERVLGGVLERVARERARPGAKLAALLMLPAAAAAALWIVGAQWASHPKPADLGFHVRGSSPGAVRVDAVCTGGTLAACPRGSRLVFHGSPSDGPRYLAAFADPIGGDAVNNAERIWYFSAEGETPKLGPSAVERSVVIGPEHVAGRYAIHVLVSTRPLPRAEAVRSEGEDIVGRESIELGVVP